MCRPGNVYMRSKKIIILFVSLLLANLLTAQSGKDQLLHHSLLDTTLNKSVQDTALAPAAQQDSSSISKKKKHDPHKATRRSLIIPGWGQAYNREYWKIPIVYGALAIPAALYFYNNSWYKKSKFAYEALYAASIPPIGQRDSSMLSQIDPKLKYKDGTYPSLNVYQSFRNSFRQGRDYSVLWFLIVWGLNVADATVFGHLKDFDVSDDLSMHVTPTFNLVTNKPALTFVLNVKKPTRRVLPDGR